MVIRLRKMLSENLHQIVGLKTKDFSLGNIFKDTYSALCLFVQTQ